MLADHHRHPRHRDAAKKVLRLIDALDDLRRRAGVYSNFRRADAILESIEA